MSFQVIFRHECHNWPNTGVNETQDVNIWNIGVADTGGVLTVLTQSPTTQEGVALISRHI